MTWTAWSLLLSQTLESGELSNCLLWFIILLPGGCWIFLYFDQKLCNRCRLLWSSQLLPPAKIMFFPSWSLRKQGKICARHPRFMLVQTKTPRRTSIFLHFSGRVCFRSSRWWWEMPLVSSLEQPVNYFFFIRELYCSKILWNASYSAFPQFQGYVGEKKTRNILHVHSKGMQIMRCVPLMMNLPHWLFQITT